MTEAQSIHIVLVDYEPQNGQLVSIVDNDVIQELILLAKEREKLFATANKLKDKNEQAVRHANKLMLRVIKSHGVRYDEETEAVGISNSDLIYVGPKERIRKDPTAEPGDNDKVKAKLTKAERRKYNELLEKYQFINDRIGEHNSAVRLNESKLISFEQKILTGKEYDSEKQSLLISTISGRVFLCEKQ